MGIFAVGDVVVVSFPFSNLSQNKVRPALVLAIGEFNDLILCQITSKSYSSKRAVQITQSNFSSGSLAVTSFARPDKLFTAEVSIIRSMVGRVNLATRNEILQQVRELFSKGQSH